MDIAITIASLLMIVAFVGLIVVLAWLAVAALALKRDVVANAKRLYERPVRSAKGVATAAKGVIRQETVRVNAITGIVKQSAALVSSTLREAIDAVNDLRRQDWGPFIAVVESAAKFANAAASVARSSSAQNTPK